MWAVDLLASPPSNHRAGLRGEERPGGLNGDRPNERGPKAEIVNGTGKPERDLKKTSGWERRFDRANGPCENR